MSGLEDKLFELGDAFVFLPRCPFELEASEMLFIFEIIYEPEIPLASRSFCQAVTEEV